MTKETKSVIKIYCFNCDHEVGLAELENNKCNSCKGELRTLKQDVAIEVTSLSSGGGIF